MGSGLNMAEEWCVAIGVSGGRRLLAVQLMANKARHPSTWDPSKVAKVLHVAPPPRPEDQPGPPVEVPTVPAPPETLAAAQPAEAPPGVMVVRWRRYGNDRLYVNDAAGDRLGWRDNKTGEVHVEGGTDATVVEAALSDWDQAGQGS